MSPIFPKGCTYRVGADERGWTLGLILVFDDTLEHKARKYSDELRVVLNFDLWNPRSVESAARSGGAGDGAGDRRGNALLLRLKTSDATARSTNSIWRSAWIIRSGFG